MNPSVFSLLRHSFVVIFRPFPVTPWSLSWFPCRTRVSLVPPPAVFWWPDLRRDIRDYTRSCDNCQRATSLAAPLKDPQPFDLCGPFQHVLMDSCGPFLLPPERPSVSVNAETEKSADKPTKDPRPASTPPARRAWILVMVDYFTKWLSLPSYITIRLPRWPLRPRII